MGAEDERAKALELVDLRKSAWTALLDQPFYAAELGARIQAKLVDDGDASLAKVEIDRYRRTAKTLSKGETKQRLNKHAAARDALVEILHRHRHEAAMFRAIVRIARGHEGELAEGQLTSAQRRAYASQLRKAESALSRARQHFVARNLRLVVTIARRYSHSFLTQEDLIQEGTLGLVRAVDGYDPSRGTRFSTYAGWWIRHGISRAIANYGLTVRVPANLLSLRAQINRAEQQLRADGREQVSNTELAETLGASAKTVAKARRAVLGQAEMPSNLRDEQTLDVDSMLDWPVVREQMHEHVAELPGIEASIIRHRFPLDGRKPMTLAQLGEVHSLSRERIRQLEKRALERIRGELQVLV